MEKEKKQEELGKWQDFPSEVGMSNTHLTGYFAKQYTYVVCIDYLKFRLTQYEGEEDKFILGLLDKLYIPRYSVTDKKATAYPVFKIYDEDCDFFGGLENQRTDEGKLTYFFEMKGHALRMFELRCKNNGIDYLSAYLDLFEYVYDNVEKRDIEMKRMDFARDDMGNIISKEEYEQKIKHDYYISRLRSSTKVDEEYHDRFTKGKKGWSWLLGNRGSTCLMIYDKKLERENKSNDVFVDSWIRVEARFQDKKANLAFLKILNGLRQKKFYSTICGLIGGLLEFKEDNKYKRENMKKAPIWIKWDELLNHSGRIDLRKSQGELEDLIVKKTEDLSMEKNISWNIEATYRSEGMIYLCDPDNYDTFQETKFFKAYQNLTQKDLAKVNYYRIKKGLRELKLIEAKDYLYNHVQYLRNHMNKKALLEKGIDFFGGDIDVVEDN